MSRKITPYNWRVVPSKAEFLLTENNLPAVQQANRITITNGDVFQYFNSSFYKRKQIIDEEQITKGIFKYLLEKHKISKFKCIVAVTQTDVYIGFRLSATNGIPTCKETNITGYYPVITTVPTREWCIEFNDAINEIIKTNVLTEEEKQERRKEQIKVCTARWYKEHNYKLCTDEYIEKNQDLKEKIEYHRKKAREWAAANPDKVKEYHIKRREAEKAKKALKNEDYDTYYEYQDEYYNKESPTDAF